MKAMGELCSCAKSERDFQASPNLKTNTAGQVIARLCEMLAVQPESLWVMISPLGERENCAPSVRANQRFIDVLEVIGQRQAQNKLWVMPRPKGGIPSRFLDLKLRFWDP